MGINFPATPTIGQKYPQPAVAGVPVYTWDGEKWTTVGGSIAAYAPPADAVPLVDATPGLVGTSTDYAREDHVHPTDTTRMPVTSLASSLAYSGIQTNGGFDIAQENGIGLGITSSGVYICDGWVSSFQGAMTVSGVAWPVSNTTAVFPGFSNMLSIGVNIAAPSLAATDFCQVIHHIEGYRCTKLAWGTSNAQPITIGFWSGHSRPGLYSIVISNAAANRDYVTTYTHNTANVAQYNVITIPGDTAGTWITDNGIGMSVHFAVASGTSFTAPSTNSWIVGNYVAASGQVNAVTTTSDRCNITGLVVIPGTHVLTAAQSANTMRPYGDELAICQRYYQTTYNQGVRLGTVDVVAGARSGVAINTTSITGGFYFNTRMRTTPTILPISYHGNGGRWSDGSTNTDSNVLTAIGVSETGLVYWSVPSGVVKDEFYWGHWIADARL